VQLHKSVAQVLYIFVAFVRQWPCSCVQLVLPTHEITPPVCNHPTRLKSWAPHPT